MVDYDMRKQNLIDLSERSQFEKGRRVMKGQQEFVTYRDDMSFRVWYGVEPDFYNEHWHSAVEIVVPHKGNMLYSIEGVPYVVGELDVLFIPAGKVHSMETPPGSVRNLILFDPQCLNSIRNSSAYQPMLDSEILLTNAQDDPLCGQVRTKLFNLMEKYYQRSPVNNLLCYSAILDIYATLAQHYIDTHPVDSQMVAHDDSFITEPIRQALNRVFDYVNVHYAEKITLDTAAAVAGFSKFYFSRIFSQFTQLPFSQYLLRKRIMVASKLLYTTDQRLLAIAIQSGFSSLSTFNRVFKNHHGCTPTEYRILYREQNNTPPPLAD